MAVLTRRQQEIFNFLCNNHDCFARPPNLDELCIALNMASRGSLYKHIMALIAAGLVEPFIGHKRSGVRLTAKALKNEVKTGRLPFMGYIAAGKPIEALENRRNMAVPDELRTEKPCYVLQVKGDSMIEANIYDGDWIVVEQRSYASNGEIVVALVDNCEATLKFIQQTPEQVLLLPANSTMTALAYRPEQVEIQGVLVGQMRSYRSH